MSAKKILSQDELDDYYKGMKEKNLGPLWKDLGEMVTTEPVHDVKPFLWKWRDIREYALKASEFLEPGKDAERRVVYLQNPSLLKKGLIGYGTHTLYVGIQLLLPGEFAPVHRHSQTAIRFIIEGDEGAHTSVDGENSYMEDGDLILTPAWTWHEHKHDGEKPVFWIDGLDVGLIKSLAGQFFELYETESYPKKDESEYKKDKFTNGAFKKINEKKDIPETSPIFAYKYNRVLSSINEMTIEDNDLYYGYAIEYINPVTGDSADSRVGTMMQKLTPDQKTKAHRHNHSAIYYVNEGTGYTIIDGQKFEWEKGDFFILPPWSFYEHANTGTKDALLFSYNDKPVIEKLDLERNEIYIENDGHQKVTSVFQSE